MPVSFRLFLVLTLLALTATAAQAQTRAEPAAAPAPQQVMTLRVTLPTAVGYAMRLLSKDDKPADAAAKTAPRTNNPVLVFTVPLPQLLTSKKPAPAPKND
ncbi:hypothetical protein LJ737_25870 [Hymenobacter sp. 15J16-1T3B]|uniref:hypothetical protein n=1 Tax=Hymenobacter sp. 15J16-1T3B TaxID=2886941 RepID=UPI001D118E9F|nr:hypothetical protein [Hymenobacter sp. 15J16-1T3B]MCC3160691.1 hypothetical protein [Hymenobacter sp. 15J16-1T3B]